MIHFISLISLNTWDNTRTVSSLMGALFGLFFSSSIFRNRLSNLLLEQGFLAIGVGVVHANELITVLEELVQGDFDVVAMLLQRCFALGPCETHVH